VGKEFALVREGGSHSIFRCGSQRVVVPRHREINEQTARGIMKDLDGERGEVNLLQPPLGVCRRAQVGSVGRVRAVQVEEGSMVEVTYSVVCRRVGGWWAISVPRLKGVHTQARRLDQVAAMARDAIALMLDVDPSTVEVEVRPELPTTVTEALGARKAAREADEKAERATGVAVRALLDDGYTVRDVGALLGLSPQRISQIASRDASGRDSAAA
jgi:predicted RNase H-like HicB family nuclease